MLDEKLALTCARLSQEVYIDFKSIKFGNFPTIEPILLESIKPTDTAQGPELVKTDTQAAILCVPDSQEIYIVFRGSDTDTDWFNNFQFRQQIYPYGDESSTDVRFHKGFMAAYFSVRDQLQAKVRERPGSAIIVTGHSLGGAVATIAALDLQYNITQHTGQPLKLYTFGAPRVGNSALVRSFRQRVPQSYRFVYGWDVVTRIPRQWQGYEHVQEEKRLGSRWTWKIISRRIQDHQISQYVAALEKMVR